MEIWKPIKNFENYEVSNLGRVKNIKTQYIRDLRNVSSSNGYANVYLRNNGIGKSFDVHRLIAEAFCKKTKSAERLEVDHINGNPLDNRASNLQWITHSENLKKRGPYKRHRDRNREILQISEDGRIINRFKSISDTSNATGIEWNLIQKCLSGTDPRTKTHGYIFKQGNLIKKTQTAATD